MSEVGTGEWVRIGEAGDVEPGTLKGYDVSGEYIVVANVDGVLYALEDRCSHEDYPLSEGDLEGDELECLLHGATFEVCTGKATGLPAVRPVRSFEIEAREDGVFVRI